MPSILGSLVYFMTASRGLSTLTERAEELDSYQDNPLKKRSLCHQAYQNPLCLYLPGLAAFSPLPAGRAG